MHAVDPIAFRPEIRCEAPPDWVSLSPSPDLAIARKAHLKRIAGRHDEARGLDDIIRAMGKNATDVYANNPNKLNLAEGPVRTAKLCMDLASARKVLGEQDFERVLRVQTANGEMIRSAEACRLKFRSC
ncbi:MAG: hypothetical protein ABIN69_12710 [Aestuariivirga sp.]